MLVFRQRYINDIIIMFDAAHRRRPHSCPPRIFAAIIQPLSYIIIIDTLDVIYIR